MVFGFDPVYKNGIEFCNRICERTRNKEAGSVLSLISAGRRGSAAFCMSGFRRCGRVPGGSRTGGRRIFRGRSAVGAAASGRRDAGFHGAGQRLHIREVFKTRVKQKVIELPLSGVILKEAEDQLGDDRGDDAGENTDQQGKEHIRRVMRHQIVP